MMNKVIWASWLLLAALGCCSAEWQPEYFPSRLLDRNKFKKLLEVLADNQMQSQSLEEILAGLEPMRKVGAGQRWSSLTELLSRNDPHSSIKFYVNIKSLQSELKVGSRDAKQKEALNLLEQLAVDKFRRRFGNPAWYVRQIMALLLSVNTWARIDEKFDSFLLAGYNLERADDEQLFGLASSFKFSNKEFCIRKSTLASLDRGPNGKLPLHEALIVHLNSICSTIQRPLELAFDVYNVAKSIDLETLEEVPIGFKKLNEYNRICLGLQNRETRSETSAMVQKAIKRSKSCFSLSSVDS